MTAIRFTRINLAPSSVRLVIACACLLFVAGAPTHAHLHAQETPPQTAAAVNLPPDTARGIELYKASNYRKAIEVLRGAVKARKQDAEAWLHLGIALSRAGENKEAHKAFEKASKLRPEMPEPHIGMALIFFAAGKLPEAEAKAAHALALAPHNAESHYAVALLRLRQESPLKALEEVNTALRLRPNFGAALSLKADALVEAYGAEQARIMEQAAASEQPRLSSSPEWREKMAKWLQEAAETLDTYLKQFPASPDAARLREQAETLRLHADALNKSDDPLVYQSIDLTTRAQIVSKPEPLYTESARNTGVKGTVTLRMLLCFDGRVRNVQVVHGLPEGLTQMSVNAARRIKFTPATKNGRPVSQFVTIEYNFNIY